MRQKIQADVDAPLPLENIYRSPSLWAWIIDHHLVVATFPRAEIHVWNPTAAAIWLLLSEDKKTIENIACDLHDVFQETSANIYSDLNMCLTQWVTNQWLEVDENNYYSIHPKITESRPDSLVKTPRNNHEVIFDHSYSISGNQFSLIISADKESIADPFVSRLTSLADGFQHAEDRLGQELHIIIQSGNIYVGKINSNYKKFDIPAEALNYCIQYFLSISAGESNHFFTLHAAAIGQDNCILLSGVSGAGKSTLCALLSLRGWKYFGDDLVGLSLNQDGEGLIVPLPSAISVKDNNWGLISSYYPELNTFQPVNYGEKTARFLPLRHSEQVQDGEKEINAIVFPRFSLNSQLSFEPISAIDALGELVTAGISLPQEMDPADIEIFFKFIFSVSLYRLEYSDFEEANAWLSTLVIK
ncbi:MAG: hypothetical protein B7X60_01655 [Polynucleobacter sp. 39-45-136]|nr:MAG: hypothetical protein B7X60_01655 [Polynucleobacter sp. 39-45-136]